MGKRLLFILLLPLMASCFKKEDTGKEEPSVLVTIPPYAEFVERITNGKIQVEALVPPGVNLHIYEPTPKHVEKAGGALVWFQIDEPFEKKITPAFKEKNPLMKIVSLQKGLDLLGEGSTRGLTPCDGHSCVGHSCMGHSHGGEDLHTWLSPKLALKQAQRIADTLISLFPEEKELFQNNFKQLASDLEALDREIDQMLAPYHGDALLVSHPAFGYFCKDYSLIQLSVECEGKDPRPKDVEEILKKAKKYSVRCVLLQAGFNNRGAQLIGEKLKLPIFSIDPYAKDYLENMRKIARDIAE